MAMARFKGWEEAKENGYLRRSEVGQLVVGYRYRPNGKRAPVTLNDVGVSVRMLTHAVRGGAYSVDGWEASLGEVRVRAVPVWLTEVQNQIGGLGAVADMFRLQDLRPLIEAARALAREKYGLIEE